jgi:hypothetical protein
MSKRIPALLLGVTLLSLSVAPETLAYGFRRGRDRRIVTTRYYGSYPYRSYYSRSYYSSYPYSGVAGTRYYYVSPYRTVSSRYYGRSYYGRSYYGRSYYGRSYYRDYRNRHSTRNAVLTVVGPAAVGAGIGAIAGGGKGAGIGALVGGGGGALYYLIKHHRRRY